MLVYGELETTMRFSKCFGLLINGDFFAMELILRTFSLFGAQLESVSDEALTLGHLRRGSA